jgi:hypothetical protein
LHTDRLRQDPETVSRLDRWVRHYFGDPTPGAATQRFHAAVAHLMEEWERYAVLHADDEETQLTASPDTASTAVPAQAAGAADRTQSQETGEDDDDLR